MWEEGYTGWYSTCVHGQLSWEWLHRKKKEVVYVRLNLQIYQFQMSDWLRLFITHVIFSSFCCLTVCLPNIFGKIVKLSSAFIQQLVPAKQFDWLRDIKNVTSRRDITVFSLCMYYCVCINLFCHLFSTFSYSASPFKLLLNCCIKAESHLRSWCCPVTSRLWLSSARGLRPPAHNWTTAVTMLQYNITSSRVILLFDRSLKCTVITHMLFLNSWKSLWSSYVIHFNFKFQFQINT